MIAGSSGCDCLLPDFNNIENLLAAAMRRTTQG